MKNLAATFLSETDKDKITSAVNEVEKITSGEIVPMIVPSSYHYPVSNIVGGFTLSVIISIGIMLILKNENMWLFLGIFMTAFIFMHEAVRMILPLKRLFISKNEIAEEVKEAAIKAFFKNELYKTRDETGVLVFISVFERKVWVLADRGINQKVDADAWQVIVNSIINGIKNKRHADAIAEAIKKIGILLKQHFPLKSDDKDELTNLIIE